MATLFAASRTIQKFSLFTWIPKTFFWLPIIIVYAFKFASTDNNN